MPATTPPRRVLAEGTGRLVTREVKYHHEARVAIIMGTHQGAPMLELTENGYGAWSLVRREYAGGSQTAVELAHGTIEHEATT